MVRNCVRAGINGRGNGQPERYTAGARLHKAGAMQSAMEEAAAAYKALHVKTL
jgi:hypothetical protein